MEVDQDYEEQLQVTMRIISSLYNKTTTSLERQLQKVKQEHFQKQHHLGNIQEQFSSRDQELKELKNEIQELDDENQTLQEQKQRLQAENENLSQLKKVLLSSLEENTWDTNLISTLKVIDDSLYQDVIKNQMNKMQFNERKGNQKTNLQIYRRNLKTESQNEDQQQKVLDAKQLYRKIKAELPNELFNEFLFNIKQMNSQLQNKEETLENIRQLLGKEYSSFYAQIYSLFS